MAKQKDIDSPWKKILRGCLPDAMDFFFPGISELIDWQIPPIFLDKEMEQLNPEDKIGKRYADHYFRFTAAKLMDYEEQWKCLESSQNPLAVVVILV